MAEIVNLRTARKRRDRAAAKDAAAAKRALHGRGRAERDAERIEAARATRTLDGARREGGDD